MTFAFNIIQAQLAGMDCNGNTYFCVDSDNYQICSDLPEGRTETTDTTTYPCPPDLFCDNSGRAECDSSTRPATNMEPVDETLPNPSQSETPSETSAEADQAPEEPSSTTTTPLFSCKEAGRFPDSTSCHNYYICLQLPLGLSQIHTNCLFGMAFDPITLRCSSDQSSCQTDSFCTDEGVFPDLSDRSGYFRCTWNGSGYEKYHMKCGLGQRFNEAQGRCTLFGLRAGGAEQSESPMRDFMRVPGRGGYN
ncbi:AAEL001028-PA [Aedes aegypti]|uniref:AAEL001028-PA n=1 Tax=Aedes aegypti TaxID=7159 RepID=Q17MH5_AEDAE|nr:AAEL001028-PA [Aedes aegypti]